MSKYGAKINPTTKWQVAKTPIQLSGTGFMKNNDMI